LDHLLKGTWSIHLQELVAQFVHHKKVLERWFLNRMRWSEQRGFSMGNILGSQIRLNKWMQSSAPSENHQRLDWTEPLVRSLLYIDEGDASGDPGMEELTLSHLEKLMIVRDLARVLTQSKRIDEGIVWFENALICRADKGEPLRRCWIMSALGILYDQRGEVHRSLDIHAQVLAIQQTGIGTKHLETIWTVNEMGHVYRHLGDYGKAEEMHVWALAALCKILPSDHLEVVWTINTLARAYRKNGKLEDALGCHQKALEGQEKALGSMHPHPLWTKGDIGKCYFGLGLLEEAENFHRRSLEGRIMILGMTHLDTLWSMAKLGQVLADNGQIKEGVGLLENALERQILALGIEHLQTRKTAATLNNLKL
jgi:tetratricopeptide (TPR) repeat protein